MIKKSCPHCRKKFEKNFDYCPWCGRPTIKKEDYGLLGKNDEEEFFNNNFSFFDKIFEKVFSDVNKIFSQNMNKNFIRELPFEKIQINFSTSPQKKQNPFNNQKELMNQEKKTAVRREVLDKNIQIIKAESNFKRLPEGILYEIKAPGVKSKKDITITPIEEGLEIRAYTKDKCYLKTIPLKINSYNYIVKDGKVFFKIKN